MYEIKDDIEFDIDKNKNYYSFYYNKNKFISFNIANTKNEVFNLDTNILNVGKRLDENQLINILKNKNFNFGNNMFNFKKAIVNNNEIITEIKNTNFVSNLINPTCLDISLTNVAFMQGLTNNNQYLPLKIEKIIYLNENKPQYVYTINKVENIETCLSDSYILDIEYNPIYYFFKKIFLKI